MSAHKIVWKGDYDTGVPDIDNQHQRLFALLDNLTRPDEYINHAELIHDLGRYIMDHFAYEADLMRRYAYPRQSEHLAQHQDLIVQYQAMTEESKASDAKTIARTRLVIYAWFTRHILGDRMDKDLGCFLKGTGVIRG